MKSRSTSPRPRPVSPRPSIENDASSQNVSGAELTSKNLNYHDAIHKEVHINERLLKPTASNIASMNAIHERDWKPEKPIVAEIDPMAHLLVPTASNIASMTMINEKRLKDDHETHSYKSGAPVQLSEHLLRPTAAQIAAQNQLLEESASLNEKDDIWWSQRTNPRLEIINKKSTQYDYVPSKLTEDTVASTVARVDKRSDVSVQMSTRSTTPSVRPIDESSRLLHLTAAVVNGSYIPGGDPALQTKETIPLQLGYGTGPQNVESRLYEPTNAYVNQVYKSKEEREIEEEVLREIEKESRGATTYRVAEPSDHILRPTTALEMAKYKKPDSEVDPREAGWKPFHHNANVISSPAEKLVGVGNLNLTDYYVYGTSEHLLMPTAATEAGRYKSPTVPKIKIPPKDLPVSDHLTLPTESMEYSATKKYEPEYDPREKSWNKFASSTRVKSLVEFFSPAKDKSSPSNKNAFKKKKKASDDGELNSESDLYINGVSVSLLRPTKANEHSRWPTPGRSRSFSSNSSIETPRLKYVHPADIRVSESLLRPTAGLENARYVPPTEKHVRFSASAIAKIDPSNTLLRTTFATNNAKYVRPEDRPKPDDFVEEEFKPSKPEMVFTTKSAKFFETPHSLRPIAMTHIYKKRNDWVPGDEGISAARSRSPRPEGAAENEDDEKPNYKSTKARSSTPYSIFRKYSKKDLFDPDSHKNFIHNGDVNIPGNHHDHNEMDYDEEHQEDHEEDQEDEQSHIDDDHGVFVQVVTMPKSPTSDHTQQNEELVMDDQYNEENIDENGDDVQEQEEDVEQNEVDQEEEEEPHPFDFEQSVLDAIEEQDEEDEGDDDVDSNANAYDGEAEGDIAEDDMENEAVENVEEVAELIDCEVAAAADVEAEVFEEQVDADVELEVETEVEPEPEVVSEAQVEAEAEVEMQQVTDLEVEVEADTQPETYEEVQAEVDAQPELAAGIEAEEDVLPQTDDFQRESEVEVEPEVEAEADVQAEPEIEGEVEPEAQPEVEAEAEVQPEPETETQDEAEVNDAIEAEVVAEVEPEAEVEAEPEMEAEAEVEPEAEPEVEASSEIKADVEADAEPEAAEEQEVEQSQEDIENSIDDLLGDEQNDEEVIVEEEVIEEIVEEVYEEVIEEIVIEEEENVDNQAADEATPETENIEEGEEGNEFEQADMEPEAEAEEDPDAEAVDQVEEQDEDIQADVEAEALDENQEIPAEDPSSYEIPGDDSIEEQGNVETKEDDESNQQQSSKTSRIPSFRLDRSDSGKSLSSSSMKSNTSMKSGLTAPPKRSSKGLS